MNWPTLELISRNIGFPSTFRMTPLKPEEGASFARALAEWYPDIRVGSESRFLDPEFYSKEIFAPGAPETRRFLPIVYRPPGSEDIAGWIFLEKNEDALTVTSPMAGVATAYRKTARELVPTGPKILAEAGRLMGAGMAYYISSLKYGVLQKIAEEAGFKITGIFPAFDRDMVREGEVKRVYEIFYAKVYAQPDEIELPNLDSMQPETMKLYRFLFGG